MASTPPAPSRRAAASPSTAAATLALVLVSTFLLLASLPGAAAASIRVRPVQFECDLRGRALLHSPVVAPERFVVSNASSSESSVLLLASLLLLRGPGRQPGGSSYTEAYLSVSLDLAPEPHPFRP